jgi:hypothetical protein
MEREDLCTERFSLHLGASILSGPYWLASQRANGLALAGEAYPTSGEAAGINQRIGWHALSPQLRTLILNKVPRGRRGDNPGSHAARQREHHDGQGMFRR